MLHKDPAQDHFRGVGFSTCVRNESVRAFQGCPPTSLYRVACYLLLEGLGINAQFDLRGKSFARCLGANLRLLLDLKKSLTVAVESICSDGLISYRYNPLPHGRISEAVNCRNTVHCA